MMTAKKFLMWLLWEFRRISIRNVKAGQEPFLYSTKNMGPGYVDIKGSVGFDAYFSPMIELLVDVLIEHGVTDIELIVGMMTGGAMPGYRLKQLLEKRLGRRIRYVYQRGARKEGGHGELDTGDRDNPFILPGCKTLVCEELVNFAGTTTNGVKYERSKGRIVEHAACILFYENPVAIQKLRDNKITLHYVIGLPELLEFGLANDFTTEDLVEQYREFLADPKLWNESRGYTFYSS